jgi:hypothetical protein
MSSRLVTKLWISGREEAKEREQAESTWRVTTRLLSTMSSRLVTRLWRVTGEKAEAKDQVEITRRLTRRVATPYVQSHSDKAQGKWKEKKKRKSNWKSLGESLKGCSRLCPVDSSELVDERQEEAKEREQADFTRRVPNVAPYYIQSPSDKALG